MLIFYAIAIIDTHINNMLNYTKGRCKYGTAGT